MMRGILIALTCLSFVALPWQWTVAFMIALSTSIPLAGIIVGVLLDLVYAPVGIGSVPLGILYGLVASGLGYAISRFLRARIMDA
jgi:hypothetical protein